MRSFFYRLLRKLGILKHLNLVTSISLNGRRYLIPLAGETGIENLLALSEPWMMTLLGKLLITLPSEKIFIDIGANIGQTLLKVRSLNESIPYIGFEPNPLCFNYLNQLVKINKFKKTDLLPVALANETTIKRLQFYEDTGSDGSASLIPDFRRNTPVKSTLHVPVFNFPAVNLEPEIIGRIGILKIDVEGAELDVLLGLREMLQTQRPLVLVEILPVYSEENAERLARQDHILQLMKELNFAILRISRIDNEFEKVTEIVAFDIHGDLSKSDYLLCPVERSRQIEMLVNQ